MKQDNPTGKGKGTRFV